MPGTSRLANALRVRRKLLLQLLSFDDALSYCGASPLPPLSDRKGGESGLPPRDYILLQGVEDCVEVVTLDIGESWTRSGGFLATFYVNADLFVQTVDDGCSADKTGDKGDLV